MKKLLLLALILTAQVATAQGIHSGIVGEVFVLACPVVGPFGCPPGRPYQATISIYNERGRRVERLTTDAMGRFIVKLNPGFYTLVPDNPKPPQISPVAYPQEVRVVRKRFTKVRITYRGGAT